MLSKLSISYKCHDSIGNSSDLEIMLDELVRTFLNQTEAISGFFILSQEENRLLISKGKRILLDIEKIVSFSNDNSIEIKEFDEQFNILIFKVKRGVLVFIYDSANEFDFIIAMFESLRKKIDISIDSCLNVKAINELNKTLEQRIKKEVNLSKQKDKKIFEKEKLAQMGELLSNVAHHWRQPLSLIATLSSGLKLKKEMNNLTDDEFFKYVDKISSSVKLLSNTLDECNEFIKETNQYKDIVIQENIKNAITIVEENFNNLGIKILANEVENEPLYFRLVSGELLQVVITILNNSKDALLKKHNDDKFIKYSIIKKSSYILITFEDNAGGISEDIIDKVFNPYFTTKHESYGIGIGLFTVYNIITNQLKGKVSIKNTNLGAKVSIKLPFNIKYEF